MNHVRHGLVTLAFVGLAGASCTQGRSRTAAALLRFEAAAQAHVEEYGAYPETIDPSSPADSLNLPYESEDDVQLRILPRPDGFQAIARRGSWSCSMSVTAGGRTAPDCFPISDSH